MKTILKGAIAAGLVALLGSAAEAGKPMTLDEFYTTPEFKRLLTTPDTQELDLDGDGRTDWMEIE